MTAEGDRVAGRYRLVEEIGRGGMGVVWRAHDELLDRSVAVKEVIYRAMSDADREAFNRRTIREARTAGRLDHPSVVVVHDVIEEDGRPWIVMQLVRSRSLGEVLRLSGPLDPRTVAGIGANVLDALRAAHAAGVLHRDVKPENVLLTDSGRVVLTDFGIATMPQETALTTTGNLTGTPAFMPPERLRGEPAVPESDLWSLGATLYAAVEGRPPFDRGAPVPTMAAVLSDAPAPTRRAGPLAPVLAALLRKDPVKRMTAEDAAAALYRVAEGEPARARGRASRRAATPPPAPGGFTLPDGRGRRATLDSPSAPLAGTPGLPPGTSSSLPAASLSGGTDPSGGASPGRPGYPAAQGTPWQGGGHTSGGTPGAGPRGQRRRGVRTAVIVALVVPLVGGLGAAGWYGYQRISAVGGGVAGGVTPAGTSGEPEGSGVPTASAGVPSGEPGSSSPEATGDATPEATPGATESAGPSTGPSAGPSAGPQAVPKGWRLHSDPLGFTIVLPRGWVEFGRQKARVSFRAPGAASYLQVDTTRWGDARPVDALRTVARESTARGWLPGYRLIELTPGAFMGWQAADWEFTWRMKSGVAHVVDRAFVTQDGRQFAIYWHTLHDQWEVDYPRFVRFAQSFRPDPL
ncbi:serine/threonine-protein kinase [Sphaerisporangium aureirubrum]|uniref:non-specific serine/threonine protein kinase n=1 Tax=Sphaerisporangium aureirubrum TaxID=1544736 RepID=A0ABW1NTD6_9ACTN